MGVLLFALYICIQYGASAPIQQPPEESTTSWQAEPNGRGTWGLLSSCIITMAICVWSAVHLNVPGQLPQGKWDRWMHQLRRTRWTFMGLLAPELVVFCAWVQWSNARELSRFIARSKYPRRHPWALSHSFFAGMGGFAIECSDFLPGQDYLYLTTAGVQRVVDLGYQLPDLHHDAIVDKSKADYLGKILVCLQAGYMIFQVVGRLAAHLPVTLLEVNTLGHVLCALAMYVFWFYKPLGICDPVLLTRDWAKPLLILWFMKKDSEKRMLDASSAMNFPSRYRELDLLVLFAHPDRRPLVEGWPKSYVNHPDIPPKRPLPRSSKSPTTPQSPKIDGEAAMDESETCAVAQKDQSRPEPGDLIVRAGLPEDLDGIRDKRILFYKRLESTSDVDDRDISRRLKDSNIWNSITHVYQYSKQEQIEAWGQRWSAYVFPTVISDDGDEQFNESKPVSPSTKGGTSAFIPQHIFLDRAGLRRWELAYRGFDLDPNAPLYVKSEATSKEGKAEARELATGLATRRVVNWPSVESGMISRAKIPAWIMALVTALYGALHSLCWHSHFPSFPETMLWRLSALVIAGGPMTIATLYYVWDYVGDSMNKHWQYMVWNVVCLFLLLACAMVYVTARVFILLEAFISLRSLPDAAYQTPNWITWLPHL